MFFTTILSFCANGYAGDCRFHIAYDNSPGRKEREFFEQFIEDERGLPHPFKKELAKFFSEGHKNIKDKFIINSALMWHGIDSNDYENFKELKKVRDDIAHGDPDMQSGLPVPKLEVLMSKLIENYHYIKT